MSMYKDLNWIISGILASILLLVLTFLFHINIILVSLLSLSIFIGGILLLKPHKLIYQDIDISRIPNQNKVIKNIDLWIDSINQLKVLSQSAEGAYVQLKAMQVYTVSQQVLSLLSIDSSGIYPLEKFFFPFLKLTSQLIRQYNEIDSLSITENNQQQKEKIRDKIERLVTMFNAKIDFMMQNDVKEITSFISAIKEISGE